MSDSDDWDPDAGGADIDDYANDGPDDTSDASQYGKNGIFADADDDDYDDKSQLQAFYEEASAQKMPVSHPSLFEQNNPYSQDEPSLSQQSNLSLAELSRMEENLLSQTSHREEEEERQRTKMKNRARRAKGIKVKRPRRPPTEIQIKRLKEYVRFKYKKGTDLRGEKDVGGSMEYLMREKLGEKAERRRLRMVAREREEKRKMKEEKEEVSMGLLDDNVLGESNEREAAKASSVDSSQNKDHHGANWNFLDEGYVTMPRAEANKLPYYLYRNSKRRLSSIHETDSVLFKASGVDIDGHAKGIHRRKKRRKSGGHLMMLKTDTAAADTRTYEKLRKSKSHTQLKESSHKTTFAIDEPDNVARSFPLHFHQLKSRMDLHGMVDTATTGADRMVLAHGRNAKRLWTRMVAGGITSSDQKEPPRMMGKINADGAKMKEEDDDSVSNASSLSKSSESSAQSYQPTGVYSQMSYGTTSVIGTENTNDAVNTHGNVGKTKENLLFRLMQMVHALPKILHRNRLIMKVAQELGTNRRLWEEELKCLVEGNAHTNGDEKDVDAGVGDNFMGSFNLTPKELWAIKSLLGVDGSISTPPSWAADPSMPTHPTVMKQRVHSLRSSLLKRLRRRIRTKQQREASMLVSGDIPGISKEGIGGDAAVAKEEVQDGGDDAKIDDKDKKLEPSNVNMDGADGDIEGCINEKCEDANNPEQEPQKPKVEAGEEDIEMMNPQSAVNVTGSAKLLISLLEELQTNSEPGGVDKYAKTIHETNIDISNIDIALACFVSELTASKARLKKKQQMDTSHFQHRHALKVAQEEVSHWHESIVSYLSLAETLAQTHDSSFYKLGGAFPQNAALAQAVMATQSYLANGGGVGCGRKRMNFQSASWEVKDEGQSSDESDASDAGNNETEPTMSSIEKMSISLEKKELRGIQLAAKEIAKRGKGTLTNKHLASFTPIHLTTGIAMIAESLTPQAAELLSRPCDPDAAENRTHFDLMSDMITLIEGDGSLISPPKSSWNSKEKMIDEMVVRSMREAALVFRKCIQSDPENVDHWSWYVATLLGMLCISFGSSLSAASKIQENAKSGHEQPERPQLECFHESRCHASLALTDFVKFAQSHGCPMFHFAVSSMLEWKQAIFLLHNPQSYESGLEVRRLHAYHSYHWAAKACSMSSIARVHQLCESNLLSANAFLDIVACAVERRPCDKNNWARLVRSLGKVDAPPATYGGDVECLHGVQTLHEEGQGWWGKHRVAEWEDQFFRAPHSATNMVKPEFVRMVASAVESSLSAEVSHYQSAQHLATKSLGGEATSIPDPNECMGWIRDLSEDSVDMDYNCESFFDDALLPSKHASNTASNCSPDELTVQTQLSRNPACEALCMKIAVACHLIGGWHPFVCNSIWWLAVKLWQSKQTSGKAVPAKRNGYDDSLAWLSMRGIKISIYIQCRLNQCLDASPKQGETYHN